MRLGNINYVWKVSAPVVFVLLVISTLFVTVLSTFDRQRQINGRIVTQVAPAATSLLTANQELFRLQTAALQAVVTNDATQFSALREQLQQANASFMELLAPVQPLVDEGLVEAEAGNLLRQLEQDAAELNRLYQQHIFQQSIDSVLSTYRQHQRVINQQFLKIEQGLGQLLGLIAEAQIREGRALAAASEQTVMRVQLGWPATVVLGLGMLWLTIAFTLAPIKRMRDAMQDIAQGDGDLSQRLTVDGSDELNQVASAFNKFVARIQSTVKRVNDAIDHNEQQAKKIRSLNNELSGISNDQKDQNDQVATAITEMNASANEVASRAQEAAHSSDSAARNTQKAKQTIESAQQSMRGLSGEIEQASNVIHTLEQSVESIVSILDVIRGIADQTNLLALNAAIEAARAGEQGRGFAVVADEVRSLASKTQDSTGEIQNMIAKLQTGSEHAVQAMHRSKQGSDQTFEQVALAVAALQKVSDAISSINDMNTQIASAANQQTVVSEDISQNVQYIATGADEMVRQVNLSAEVAEALNLANVELHNLIRQFKH